MCATSFLKASLDLFNPCYGQQPRTDQPRCLMGLGKAFTLILGGLFCAVLQQVTCWLHKQMVNVFST